MFKRKLKIKQIAMASVGDMVFTIGLGNDNQCYSWDATNVTWRPYAAVKVETDAS